jgi:antitoxin component YwqK of YwqJK toxin-antitoxin module
MGNEKIKKAIVLPVLMTNSFVGFNKIISSVGLIFCILNTIGQTVISSSLITENEKLFFQNSLYTGQVLDYYNNAQLKSKYTVKDGVLSGACEVYHFDYSFNKSLYKDSALISELTREINDNENRLIVLETNRSTKTAEVNDFILYSIGGVKKLEKLKLKNAKDKLNKKQKSLHNEYILKQNFLAQIESEIAILTGKQKKYEEDLKTERNKPSYLNRKSSIIHYKNGQRDGAFEELSEEGFIIVKGNYKNGLMDGQWVYYFMNKQKKAIGSFLNGDGGNVGGTGIPRNGREGKWILYYENGNKSQEHEWKNGVSDGLSIVYHENGNKYQEINWKNEVKDGLFKQYHKNGQLEREGQYVNDIVEGKWKYFYENGQLEQDIAYDNGELNGLAIAYYENGNIEREGYFVKGTAHGATKIYHSNGKIKIKCNVDSTSLADDNVFGDFYEYKEDGTISKHVFVEKDGTIVDKMKKNNTHKSTGTNTSHNCSWCGKNFKGPSYLYNPILPQDHAPCTVSERTVFQFGMGLTCSKKCAMEECMSNK